MTVPPRTLEEIRDPQLCVLIELMRQATTERELRRVWSEVLASMDQLPGISLEYKETWTILYEYFQDQMARVKAMAVRTTYATPPWTEHDIHSSYMTSWREMR